MHQPLQLPLPEGLHLRPSAPDDAAFLEHLYASTREDLQALGPTAEPLIRMQCQAKIQGYQQNYPRALNFVIQYHNQAIGQVMLDQDEGQIRVVELALIPEERHRGRGKAILEAIQHYATQHAAPIRLTVNQSNYAAKRLYLALGFRTQAVERPHEQMVWHPG